LDHGELSTDTLNKEIGEPVVVTPPHVDVTPLCCLVTTRRSFTGIMPHSLDGTPIDWHHKNMATEAIMTASNGTEESASTSSRTCVEKLLLVVGSRDDSMGDFFLLVVVEVLSLREQVAVCLHLLKTDHVSSIVDFPSESERDNKSSFMEVNTTGCPSGSGSISFSTGKIASYILIVGMSTCKFAHGTHTSSMCHTNESHSHPFGGTQINGDIILDGSDTLTPQPPNIWRRLSFRMRKVVHLTGILIGNSIEIIP
jgi:hypothetical protein